MIYPQHDDDSEDYPHLSVKEQLVAIVSVARVNRTQGSGRATHSSTLDLPTHARDTRMARGHHAQRSPFSSKPVTRTYSTRSLEGVQKKRGQDVQANSSPAASSEKRY